MFDTKMTKELLQTNIKRQTTDQGSSENTSRIDALKKPHLGLSLLNYNKSKTKKKILKEARRKKHLTYRGTKVRKGISNFSEIMTQEDSRVKYLKC